MTEKMKNKIDAILENLKDPESGLSVSALGLVKKLRYCEEKKHLYIFTDFISHQPGCLTCSAIASLISASIIRELEKSFSDSFPDLTIEFV